MNKNINKIYLDERILEEMGKYFEEENFIQLNDFFDKKYIDEIKSKLKNTKFEKKYNPIKYRFEEFNFKENYDLDLIKIIEFFKSDEFIDYIEKIVQINLEFKNLKIRKYSQKDFTLLHDEQEKEDIIEIIFDLSSNWTEKMGGVLTYLSKNEEIFYLNPQFNSLTILYKSEEIMKYLKYINNQSLDKNIIRFEIIFEISD